MRRMLFSFFCLSLLFLFSSALLGQTVNTGFNASAVKKAAITFRNFNSGGGQEVYLGNGDLSLKNTINDVTWSSTTHVKFSYNSATGVTTALVQTTPNKSTTFTTGNLGAINYIELEVVGGQSATTVRFNNMLINSSPFTGNSFLAPTNKFVNITGVTLTSGFTIEGDIVMTGSQPGGDANHINIKVGYLLPPDNQAPVVTNILAAPNYVEVGNDITLTATVDDSQTGNSNISSAEYSFDGSTWYPMTGSFTSSTVDVTATLSNLSCGEYTVCIRGTDAQNNVSTSVCTDFIVYEKGSVSGKVLVNDLGVGGVIIKLLDLSGNTIVEVGSAMSEPNTPAGYYEFLDLIPGDYRLMVILPLGYATTTETKDFTIAYCDNDVVEDFELTPVTIANNARSKGYWKHQFDVFLTGKGKAQETAANLKSFINLIDVHYISHYNLIFNTDTSFAYWSELLNYGGPNMYKKATGQLAALVLNMASLKISQSEIVTLDGRDVADVITYASEILSDPTSTASQLELAKDICEYVNTQIKIAAGIVPDFNILYKTGAEGTLPSEYSLGNYPNPFNPSTVINYALPKSGHVSIKVYDILGKEVSTLVNEQKEAGFYSVTFNPSTLTSGMYLYVLQSGNFFSAKKMLYLK